MTETFNYWPMRRRLLARGASSVSIAPIHLPDWICAAFVGLGPLMLRTAVAIRRAHRAAGFEPILVVGHSAGGILTRLAMSDAPFRGRRAAVSDAVGALVTLGTPHGMSAPPVRVAHAGLKAARFLGRTSPGAFFLPTTGYVTVASDLVRPDESAATRLWDRLRGRAFLDIVGPHTAEGGDGIVAEPIAHLAGAVTLTYPDVRHGHIGGPWYGDSEIIDRWWPVALDAWRRALIARSESSE